MEVPTVPTQPRATDRLRNRLQSGGRCPRCGYDLRQHTGVQCPECGFVLAAELLDGGDPVAVRYGVWFHRVIGIISVVAAITCIGRPILAALAQTPRPSPAALIPLSFAVGAWVMFELTRFYVEAARRAGRLSLLLGVVAVGSLISAWRLW